MYPVDILTYLSQYSNVASLVSLSRTSKIFANWRNKFSREDFLSSLTFEEPRLTWYLSTKSDAMEINGLLPDIGLGIDVNVTRSAILAFGGKKISKYDREWFSTNYYQSFRLGLALIIPGLYKGKKHILTDNIIEHIDDYLPKGCSDIVFTNSNYITPQNWRKFVNHVGIPYHGQEVQDNVVGWVLKNAWHSPVTCEYVLKTYPITGDINDEYAELVVNKFRHLAFIAVPIELLMVYCESHTLIVSRDMDFKNNTVFPGNYPVSVRTSDFIDVTFDDVAQLILRSNCKLVSIPSQLLFRIIVTKNRKLFMELWDYYGKRPNAEEKALAKKASRIARDRGHDMTKFAIALKERGF